MYVLNIDSEKDMQQIFSVVWGVGFICMFPLAILNFYFMYKLLRSLRKQYPSTWEGLGSPTIFFNNSMKNTIATLRFIYKKEYKKLNDQSISTVCKRVFFIQIIGYFVFGFAVISFFIVIATSQH